MGKVNSLLEAHVNMQLLNMKCGNVEQSVYAEYRAITGLLELDTINRVFNLHDSNDGNFGYLRKEYYGGKEDIRLVGENWLKSEHSFKIVDFIAPSRSDSYVIENIFDTFLKGNSVTRYADMRLMNLAICRHFEGRPKDLEKKNNAEKIYFGRKVIESLDKRFDDCGGLKKVLERAKSELEEFLGNNKCKEISSEYLKSSLKDIDNYTEGIITNYDTLKSAIESWKEEQ